MRRAYITTTDNPYDPAKDFDNWYNYDISHGYQTCEKLARMAVTSNGFSERENNEQIERAIDRIIAIHCGLFYKKLVTES